MKGMRSITKKIKKGGGEGRYHVIISLSRESRENFADRDVQIDRKGRIVTTRSINRVKNLKKIIANLYLPGKKKQKVISIVS